MTSQIENLNSNQEQDEDHIEYFQLRVEEVDEEQVPRACIELDDMVDADVQLNLKTINTNDYDYEAFDNTRVGQPWFTTSGDNPVIHEVAWKNDQRNRNIHEVQAPRKDFYSVAKPLRISRKDLQRTQQNFQTVIGFIFKNRENKALIQKAWMRYLSRSNEERHFVTRKQDQLIRNTFKRLGA